MSYQTKATEVRKQVLNLVYRAQTSHIGSNFSAADIAVVLYENLKDDDVVVWSKGWAAALIYTMLYRKGVLSEEEIKKFPEDPYLGLAETSVKGVEVAGGSMGHGLPVAVGMAIAKKRAGEEGRVYCIMSDGEWQEGTTWESALLAGNQKLDNLFCFTDWNKWTAMGRTEEVADIKPHNSKWLSFKWRTEVINGHNHYDIEAELRKRRDKPTMIIADTVKGKGVSFMEDYLLYHYKYISEEEYKNAMNELNEKAVS